MGDNALHRLGMPLLVSIELYSTNWRPTYLPELLDRRRHVNAGDNFTRSKTGNPIG